jgi:hypothetical protein
MGKIDGTAQWGSWSPARSQNYRKTSSVNKATFFMAGSIVASSVLFAQPQTSPKFEAKANIVVVPVSVRGLFNTSRTAFA